MNQCSPQVPLVTAMGQTNESSADCPSAAKVMVILSMIHHKFRILISSPEVEKYAVKRIIKMAVLSAVYSMHILCPDIVSSE